ncbi:MAG: 30S ribosomal protein S17 [Nanoarchaeota archaeon]|nr:30S ribosomal protein S17 [Nanoarchaeota archaeon]
MKQKVETKTEEKKLAEAGCNDPRCIFHGKLKARGRTFEGKIVKKFPKRIAIELERMVYVRKYERYKKSKIKIHAVLSDCMEKETKIGDIVRVQECRPLSKLIHFVVIEKIKDKENEK